METKQVVVVRKDLNMRRGKLAAQASHASMAFLTKNVSDKDIIYYDGILGMSLMFRDSEHGAEIYHWIKSSFAKICVYVNSEEELMQVYSRAQEKNLVVHLITDSGKTEFNGVPTKTCLAIGPHFNEKFEGVTDQLSLY